MKIPSINYGHILLEYTNKGIYVISAIVTIIILSVIINNLSGIPNVIFSLVINNN